MEEPGRDVFFDLFDTYFPSSFLMDQRQLYLHNYPLAVDMVSSLLSQVEFCLLKITKNTKVAYLFQHKLTFASIMVRKKD